MPILRFEHPDLPEASRGYVVDLPAGMSVDAAVKSMADDGWRLVVDENADGSVPDATNSEAQSAPTNPEGN